ncbi:hypothetical protein FA13DRAFT_1743043, partial [Coprinellus micaceus]
TPLTIIVACILGPNHHSRMPIYHHWRSLHHQPGPSHPLVVSFALNSQGGGAGSVAPKTRTGTHCSMLADHQLSGGWDIVHCEQHYPSFVHSLTSATPSPCMVATRAARALIMLKATKTKQATKYTKMALSPVRESIISLVSPFAAYHFYLSRRTGQTTLEHIHSLHAARHLPLSPARGNSLLRPPLSRSSLVKDAHSRPRKRPWWRRNWLSCSGGDRGDGPGDGMHHPRNPRAEDILAQAGC